MKKLLLCIPLFFVFFTSSAFGADKLMQFPIDHAMQNVEVANAIYKNVALYWGQQKSPAIVQKFGTYRTSKRTNAFAKASQGACEWALASAIKALQEQAMQSGADAVINIRSNIKNNPYSSASHFQCLVGTIMANSALIGDVVKLAK